MIKTKTGKKTKKESKTVEDIGSENKTEQIDLLLNKSFNLIGTGLELGVNIISKLGDLVQTKMPNLGQFTHPSQPVEADRSDAETHPETGADKVSQPESSLIVYNRIPAMPGSVTTIPFSVNNDSPQKAILQFKVGDKFTGEYNKKQIDGKNFKIKPSKQIIGPMDFEKIIFSGSIPSDIPFDIYRGVIIVNGEKDEYQIPVVLVVGNIEKK